MVTPSRGTRSGEGAAPDGRLSDEVPPAAAVLAEVGVKGSWRRWNRSRSIPVSQLVISALAVAVALLHMLLPRLQVDMITVALVAIAALPWLAPILKSVKLPGGLELVLQDIHDKVEAVNVKVEENSDKVEQLTATVERYVFEGQVSQDLEETVSNLLDGFRSYMSQIGAAVDGTPPTVSVLDPPYSTAAYALSPDGRGTIMIGRDTPDYNMLRPYALHLLGGGEVNSHPPSAHWIILSSLGFYFPASFLEAFPPVLSPILEGGKLTDVPAPDATDADLMKPAIAWARLLWGTRAFLSGKITDPALADAWLATRPLGATGTTYGGFVGRLLASLEQTDDPRVGSVRFLFDSAGVSVDT
jgi:hypothetical protein